MKVLAIDPGYDRLGVAIMERVHGADVLLYSTCVTSEKTASFEDRIYALGCAVEKLIHEHKPDTVAVETLFFNKNIKTGIGVAHMRGIILFLAKKNGCALNEFGPQEIKVATTGYGKSDKTAVIHMVKKLVKGAPETALDDEYDAIAVGLTALAHFRG